MRSITKEENEQTQIVAQKVVSKEVLTTQWTAFIEALENEGKSFLASHLKMCNVDVVQDGKITLKSAKKFSFESLQTEVTELRKEAIKFFGGLLEVELLLDKASIIEAMKSEKSALELFKELSETNPVIQYLIKHFGVEPLY